MGIAEKIYGGYEVPNFIYNEDHWKEGIHYDSHDRKHLISEMTTDHLRATIHFFSELDTGPLEHELYRRESNAK